MAGAARADGVLALTVWPAYVGLGWIDPAGAPVEPDTNPDYQRGQITWRAGDDGGPVGHGRVQVPAGDYTVIVYAQAPAGGLSVSGARLLAHPLTLTEATPIDVAEITAQTTPGRIL